MYDVFDVYQSNESAGNHWGVFGQKNQFLLNIDMDKRNPIGKFINFAFVKI